MPTRSCLRSAPRHLGGLTAGMPIGASGSRTAVNDSMRVDQSGRWTGQRPVAVAVILLFLTEPIQCPPTAVLASIIIVPPPWGSSRPAPR